MFPQDDKRLPVKVTNENAQYLGGPSFEGPPASILQKMYEYFAKDPNQFVLAPSAIALNTKTLPIFMDALEEAAKKTAGNPKLAKAIAFMKTRYPRFASQVPINRMTGDQVMDNPGVLGMFEEPRTNPYGVNYGNEIYINQNQSLEDMINTVGHELTHARQFKKMDPGDWFVEKLLPYEMRRTEDLASQGGFTSQLNFNKLVKLFRESR